MIEDDVQLLIATPPADLPHDTRQKEILQLADYISVKRYRDDGTDYIVTDATKLGAAENAGRIYIERDVGNAITAIKTKIAGVWTRWTITTADINPAALDTTLYIDSATSKLKVYYDNETIKTRAADTAVGDTNGKTKLYAKPLVDGVTIAYKANAVTGYDELTVPDVTKYFVGHVLTTEGYAVPSPMATAWPAGMSMVRLTKEYGAFDIGADMYSIEVTSPGVYYASLMLLGHVGGSVPADTQFWAKLTMQPSGGGSFVNTPVYGIAAEYGQFTAGAAAAATDHNYPGSTSKDWSINASGIIVITAATVEAPARVRCSFAACTNRPAFTQTFTNVAFTADNVWLNQICLAKIGNVV